MNRKNLPADGVAADRNRPANVYPLSWHAHQKLVGHLQRGQEELPWDVQRQQYLAIAYWWTRCFSDSTPSAPPSCMPPQDIQTYEAHNAAPSFSLLQRHAATESTNRCAVLRSQVPRASDPITYRRTELGKRTENARVAVTMRAADAGRATSRPCRSTAWPCCSARS